MIKNGLGNALFVLIAALNFGLWMWNIHAGMFMLALLIALMEES
jgi:hypothetical protein